MPWIIIFNSKVFKILDAPILDCYTSMQCIIIAEHNIVELVCLIHDLFIEFVEELIILDIERPCEIQYAHFRHLLTVVLSIMHKSMSRFIGD